tara:strand:- start:144 stop:362 length:219 start_codon:yes stop_codon:yes gene_type:complete
MMTVKQAVERLREMRTIEEKLLSMLSDQTMVFHEQDLKIITTKIFEVSSLILQLQAVIQKAKDDNRRDSNGE